MRSQPPRDSAAMNVFQCVVGPGSPPDIELKIGLLQQFRASSPDAAAEIDRMLLAEIGRTHAGLESARAAQEEIRKLVETFTAPPYFPGVFLSRAGQIGENALVRVGGELRAVGFGDNDPEEFQPGDEMLLSHERNFIYCKAPLGAFTSGETASFRIWRFRRGLDPTSARSLRRGKRH